VQVAGPAGRPHAGNGGCKASGPGTAWGGRRVGSRWLRGGFEEEDSPRGVRSVSPSADLSRATPNLAHAHLQYAASSVKRLVAQHAPETSSNIKGLRRRDPFHDYPLYPAALSIKPELLALPPEPCQRLPHTPSFCCTRGQTWKSQWIA
jgi:hypothetical protein